MKTKHSKQSKGTKPSRKPKARAVTVTAEVPQVNPTVEIITGQPLPEEQPLKPAAQKPARSKRKAGKTGDGRLSLLDAAAKVLAEAGSPMNCTQMVQAVLDGGHWSPARGGRTPHATLYASILREINLKGAAGRFRKVDRGLFTLQR